MDKKQMKIGAIVCGVICVICIFIAIERYSTNAGNVRAINALRELPHLRPLMPGGNKMPEVAMRALGRSTRRDQLEPAMPTATKYAIFFAVISGIGGGILFARSENEDASNKIDSKADEMS
jgi:hypothetical protein